MTIRRFVKVLFAILFLLATTTAVLVGNAVLNRRKLVDSQRRHFLSYQLAEELRQSSNDLTRFVRTYVVTGDPKYEQYYRDVLAIRNGEKPRPEHYDRAYWDLLIANGKAPTPPGEAISLQQRMRETGFTDQELAKLRESEGKSNALAQIEDTAIHAIKGQFRDDQGRFTKTGPPDQAMALRLVNDDAYHQAKGQIMAPIGEFLAMVDDRTTRELERFQSETTLAFRVIEGVLGAFVLVVALSYPLIRRRILNPVKSLQEQTRMVGADLERLATVATQIAHGELLQPTYAVSTTAIRSDRKDEIGELSRLHDSMRDQLQETGAAIATMTGELIQANDQLAVHIEDLRKAHHLLEEILNSTPVGVAVSVESTYRFVNPAFREMLDIQVGMPAGQNITDPAIAAYIRDECARVGSVRGLYFQVRGHDTILDVLGSFYRIEFEGTPSVLIWLVDITQLKNTEKELEKARQVAEAATQAKSDFLANMSHEIRTPLNAIVGMTHLVMQAKLPPQQQAYVSRISASTKVLLSIVNDVLDFSKIEAGMLKLETVSFSLDEVLDGIANLTAAMAEEKGIELMFNRSRNVPRRLKGDPLRLSQILTNLANNAVKFTRTGEIVLNVDIEEMTEGAVTLRFSVRDTGIGMTPEQTGRIFQAFTQADSSTTRQFGGTGLGLSISKHLTELMHGRIWVESQPGVGSEFFFTAKFELEKQEDPDRFSLPVDLRGKRVLVADDNATSREVLKNMLRGLELEPIEARDGKEALAVLENPTSAGIDFVLVDWKMPEMDGFQTVAKIRSDKGKYGAPKVLMVTAYGRQDVTQRPEAALLDGFLLKPTTESILFDALMTASGKTDGRSPKRDTGRPENLHEILGARILVVDDNEINQQVAREILEQAGLVVFLANNGQEAVLTASTVRYDAILMDVQMPIMDGLEATRRIRASGAAWSSLPIIAMTAHAREEDAEKCRAAGMDDHLGKPIDPAQMLTKLINRIDRREVIPPGPNCPVPAAADSGGASLPPSLAGIDMEDGLRRTGGNVSLYRSILLKVRTDFAGAANEIRSFLSVDNFAEARRIAHSVKGVAGNLGAKSLYSAASDLEALLREGLSKNVPPAVEEFEKSLKTVIEGLAAIAVEPLSETGTAGSAAGQLTTLPATIVNALREATARADIGRLESIIEDIEKLDSAVAARLRQFVEDFNYDGLRTLLDSDNYEQR